MMWYRKDKLFLFLQIFRNDPLQRNPYEIVAAELLHWFNLDREAFDTTLHRQLSIAEYATEYIKKGYVSVEYDCKDAVEHRVLRWLIESGRIKVTGLGKEAAVESRTNWLERHSRRFSEDIDNDNYSACGKCLVKTM